MSPPRRGAPALVHTRSSDTEIHSKITARCLKTNAMLQPPVPDESLACRVNWRG